METMLSHILSFMLEYQKANNIEKQCITNTQYLYDCITKNYPNENVKAKAVICVPKPEDINNITCIVHMVITVNGEICEPSYEVYCIENIYYFDTIETLNSVFTNITYDRFTCVCSKFNEFLEMAEQINNSGLLICDKSFYESQAEYVNHRYFQ